MTLVIPTFWVAWVILGGLTARSFLLATDEGGRLDRLLFGAYVVLMGPAHLAAEGLEWLGTRVAEWTLLRA